MVAEERIDSQQGGITFFEEIDPQTSAYTIRLTCCNQVLIDQVRLLGEFVAIGTLC